MPRPAASTAAKQKQTSGVRQLQADREFRYRPVDEASVDGGPPVKAKIVLSFGVMVCALHGHALTTVP